MKPAQPVIALRPIQRAMSHVLVSEDTQHVFYTLSNGKLWNTQVSFSNILTLVRVRAESKCVRKSGYKSLICDVKYELLLQWE